MERRRARQLRFANNFPRIIEPDHFHEISSQGAQVRELSLVPKERMKYLIPS